MSKELIERLLDNRVTGFNLTVAAVEAAECIERLEQQLAAAREERDELALIVATDTGTESAVAYLQEQLAATLAAIKSKDAALQSAISAHGYESGDLHDALAIQPDDSALKAWIGEPVGVIEFGGFWLNEHNKEKVKDGTPLYATKWMTK